MIDGRFIVFEGIDGAGTSTQVERYAEHLRARRRLVHTTREPSGGPAGSLLRLILTHRVTSPAASLPQAMALLFAADRLDHLAMEIEPHLRDGAVVLSDRYDLSSLTYQSATATAGEGEAMAAWIRELNRFAMRPHVTVVLDVPHEVAARRRLARGGAAELYDDDDLQERLARAYRDAERLVPGDRVVHVDGDGSPEEVSRRVATLLDPLLDLEARAPR